MKTKYPRHFLISLVRQCQHELLYAAPTALQCRAMKPMAEVLVLAFKLGVEI